METQLATTETPGQQIAPISTEAILTRRAQILHVMENVMKKDVHYGQIPGCPKPSLYQSGAEILNSTFRLGIRHEVASEIVTAEEISYSIRSIVFDQQSGTILGDAVGSCSTSEEKYAWRKSFDDEWNATAPELRREKWYQGRNGAKNYQQKQIHTNPADLRNTVLAMACKRADVRATRAALAASDLFDVNSEDLPEEIREAIFGEDDNTKTAKANQQQKANRMEQHARAGVSGRSQQAPPPQQTADRISNDTVRGIMQLIEQIPGFTEWSEEKQKNTWAKPAFDFLRALGISGKITELSQAKGDAALAALQQQLEDIMANSTGCRHFRSVCG